MRPGISGSRSFFRLCSAAAVFLAGPQQRRARAAPQNPRPAVKHRKNFVTIQVKPYAWVDEGIDQLLDTVQQKGAVNTVRAYTNDYAEARMTKDGTIPLPDHGKPGDTSLTEFRSPDYGKFNVIAEVAPKAKARGMDFFAWDYNNAVPLMNRNIPNFAKVTEIDVYGRRTTSPCFNHPEYRAHLEGKIESLLAGYPSEVDGIASGCERMGTFQNAIGEAWRTVGISCFCEHCRTRARENGVSRGVRTGGISQARRAVPRGRAGQAPRRRLLRDLLAPLAGVPRNPQPEKALDRLRRNQFGGTIGGPIRKDKIFLFNGFQATRTRTAPPQSISFVPTRDVLAGDFSVVESAASL